MTKNQSRNVSVLSTFFGLSVLLTGCGQPMQSVPNANNGFAGINQPFAQTLPNGQQNQVPWMSQPAQTNSAPLNLSLGQNQPTQQTPSQIQPQQQLQQQQALNWNGRFRTEMGIMVQNNQWLVDEIGIIFQGARDGSAAFSFQNLRTGGQFQINFGGNFYFLQNSNGWTIAASSPQPFGQIQRAVVIVAVPGNDLTQAQFSFRDCGAAQDCGVEIPVRIRPGLVAF